MTGLRCNPAAGAGGGGICCDVRLDAVSEDVRVVCRGEKGIELMSGAIIAGRYVRSCNWISQGRLWELRRLVAPILQAGNMLVVVRREVFNVSHHTAQERVSRARRRR